MYRMKICKNVPAKDGYHMPAEFEHHSGCIMIWPARPGSWPYGAKAAREVFARIIAVIAESEKVYVAAGQGCIASALTMLLADRAEKLPGAGERFILSREGSFVYEKLPAERWRANVEVFLAETDDAWARDVAPTFVVKNKKMCACGIEQKQESLQEEQKQESLQEEQKQESLQEEQKQESLQGEQKQESVQEVQKQEFVQKVQGNEVGRDVVKREVRAVNWEFNAWGGDFDGLYASWEKDNAFASFFAGKYGFAVYEAAPFVLEGGAIHSDGEGTVMVTESCLLSKGRNPHLSKTEIESKLKNYLGAEKVLWLPFGIYQDETNEHIDNVCAYLRPGEVVLAWTEKKDDPQYAMSAADLAYLERETDARGRKIMVHKLPIPDIPVCVREEDLKGYVFEAGEDRREEGERLAASYVNFYFSNHAVVMPVFGGENEASDRRAVEIMERLNPGRRVVPIPARDILVGGGNIHCITQQIPSGCFNG